MKKINKKWLVLLTSLTLYIFCGIYFARYPFSIETLQEGFKTLEFYGFLAFSLMFNYFNLFSKTRVRAFVFRVIFVLASVMFLGLATMSIIMGDEKDSFFYFFL